MERIEDELRVTRAELSGRIDGLQRTMAQFGGATLAAVIATLVSVVLTQT